MEQDWSEIVRRCQQGDSDAWKEFVEAHRGFVYSLCYSITGSSRDADDLVQDAFIKSTAGCRATNRRVETCADDHGADPQPGGGPLPAQPAAAHDRVDGRGLGDQRQLHAAEQLEDERPSPHDALATQEMQTLVRQAMDRIPARMREAVSLRYFQRMNYREIAQKLRVPEGTIKSRINRAHAELAGLLNPRRCALGLSPEATQ